MQLAIEFRQPFGRADVGPAPGVQFALNVAARDRGVEQRAQFERRVRADAGEEGRVEDADAGVSVRRPAVGQRHRVALQREVAASVLRRVGDEDQVGEGVVLGAERGGERRGAGNIPVAPDVAVDHQEGRFAEARQREAGILKSVEERTTERRAAVITGQNMVEQSQWLSMSREALRGLLNLSPTLEVFQDSAASLNPRLSIDEIIGEFAWGDAV